MSSQNDDGDSAASAGPSKAQDTQGNAPPDGGPSPMTPPDRAVDPPSPTADDDKTRQEDSKKPPKEKDWSRRIELWMLGGLLLVAVVQAVATWLQWTAMSEQKRQSEEISKRQLRAYLTPTTVTIVRDADGKFLITMFIKNSGQTPAMDVEINSDKEITEFPYDGKLTLDRLDPKRHISRSVFGPGTELEHIKKYQIGVGDIEAIKQGDGDSARAFWFFGRIQYRDIYQKWHTTWFRFISGGNAKLTGMERAVFASSGNYMTDDEKQMSSDEACAMQD